MLGTPPLLIPTNKMTATTTTTLTEDQKRLAQVRLWSVWIGHLALAPASSLYYAARTSYWMPFGLGTALAVFGLPLMLIDFGLTAFILAPVASAVALQTKVKEMRRKAGVEYPEDLEGK